MLTMSARRVLLKRYGCLVVQARGRMSQVKKVELAVAQGAGTKTMSLDHIFKKEWTRVKVEGGKEEVNQFQTIAAAWSLVPAEKKSKMVNLKGDATPIRTILETLEETGALREHIRHNKREAVDTTRASVDETAARVTLCLIVLVILATWVSVHNYNLSKSPGVRQGPAQSSQKS